MRDTEVLQHKPQGFADRSAGSSDFGQNLLAPSGMHHTKAVHIHCPSERLRDLSQVTQPGSQEAGGGGVEPGSGRLQALCRD